MFFRSQKYSGCHTPQDASINTRKGWSVWRWTDESGDTDILWASTRKDFYVLPFCDAHLIDQGQKKELVLHFLLDPCVRTATWLSPAFSLTDDPGKGPSWEMLNPSREKGGLFYHACALFSNRWERTLLWQILFSNSELMLKLPSDKRASWSFIGSLNRQFKSCFLCILTLPLPGCILIDTQSTFA